MKTNTFFNSVSAMFIATFIVKAVAFVKQVIVAHYYGTTIETDIFYNAYGFITVLISCVFAQVSIALVQIYTKEKQVNGIHSAFELIGNTTIFFSGFSLIITGVIFSGANIIAKILAPTYDSLHTGLMGQELRLLSLTLPCILVYIILNAVCNVERKFLLGNLPMLLQSAFFIIFTIIGSKQWGIKALLFGALVYPIVADLILVLFLKQKYNFRYHIKAPFKDKRVKKLLLLTVPLFISSSTDLINVTVDNMIGSSLQEGAVSALNYASTIYIGIESVIVMSIVQVFHLNLSEKYAEKRKIDEKQVLGIISKTLFILVFLTLFCILENQNIVKLLYQRGSFNNQSVILTSLAFLGYSVRICFRFLEECFKRIFFIKEDMKTPMKFGFYSVGFNWVLSIVLGKYVGVFGIAIATSIASIINAGLLLKGLNKQAISINIKSLGNRIYKHVIAGIVVILYGVFFGGRVPFTGEIMIVVTNFMIMGFIYLGVSKALKAEEIGWLTDKLKKYIKILKNSFKC